MTRLLLILAAALLAGCSTLDSMLINRVSCTLDRKQGAFVSWYGPIGISAKIADADAEVMCQGTPVIIHVTPASKGS